jgi:excisionase family DNA binding protein
VDGIIFVLNPKNTSAKATRQAINTFNQRNNIQITGIALNRASWDYYSDQHYRIQGDYSGVLKRILSLVPLIKSQHDPNLISLKQAAKVLGVQNKTVKLWCREGKLPAVKKNLQWWLKKDQLISFLHDRYGYSYSDQRESNTRTGRLKALNQPEQAEEGSDQIQIATDLVTGNLAETKEQYAAHPKLR